MDHFKQDDNVIFHPNTPKHYLGFSIFSNFDILPILKFKNLTH